MKILMVHNFYQQAGGEDVVFAAEKDLLRQHGHEVIEFTAHNDQVEQMDKLKLATNTLWSREYKQKLTALIAQTRPDIAHFHNTFMVISPAAYYACREAGIPIIQTLHNYRLFCLNATFYRDNHVCEDCLGKFFPLPGVIHACYRDSKVVSGVVASMLTTHRALGTWTRVIDRYIALTEFARDKFVEAGLPAEKLCVKPNFLKDDPGLGQHQGRYMIFVGRLTAEKGIMTLLEAWKNNPDIPLKIVGDGPLMEEVRAFVAAHQLTSVEIMGRQKREDTLALIQNAYALLFPSQWYEGMPMTIIEAFACGTPVIGSELGSVAAVIADGRNGLRFEPGNPLDLAEKARALWTKDQLAADLGQAARNDYEHYYTAENNYTQLLQIYTDVLQRRQNIG